MDGSTLSPGTPGDATLAALETHIARTHAAALAVSRWTDDAMSSIHPAPEARRFDGLALLIDPVVYVGLAASTVDLLKASTATSDSFAAIMAGGEQ